MEVNKKILPLSYLWLCLNLFRYNLFGFLDTWENFMRFDILSWAITVILLFLLSDSKLLKSIFLFTFIIMLSALFNAFSFIDDKMNYSELVFLALAVIAVCLFNIKSITANANHAWKTIRLQPKQSPNGMKIKLIGRSLTLFTSFLQLAFGLNIWNLRKRKYNRKNREERRY